MCQLRPSALASIKPAHAQLKDHLSIAELTDTKTHALENIHYGSVVAGQQACPGPACDGVTPAAAVLLTYPCCTSNDNPCWCKSNFSSNRVIKNSMLHSNASMDRYCQPLMLDGQLEGCSCAELGAQQCGCECRRGLSFFDISAIVI